MALHLAAFALIGWALWRMLGVRVAPQPVNLLLWLGGGLLLHDLVLLPGYSAVDGALRRLPAPARNHVRVPLAVSGVLLLAYLPSILQRQPWNAVNALGHPPSDYLGRWLLLSGALLGGSLALLPLRVRRARRRGDRPGSP